MNDPVYYEERVQKLAAFGFITVYCPSCGSNNWVLHEDIGLVCRECDAHVIVKRQMKPGLNGGTRR